MKHAQRLLRGLPAMGLLVTLLLLLSPARAVAPLAQVTISGADGQAGKLVPVTVHNQFGVPVKLRRAITVDRFTGKGWVPLRPAAAGLLLRKDCTPTQGVINTNALLKGCLEVGPRATFRGQPWLGTHGDAQCICTRCVPVPPGTYRYTGRYCDGKQAMVGVAFRLR